MARWGKASGVPAGPLQRERERDREKDRDRQRDRE